MGMVTIGCEKQEAQWIPGITGHGSSKSFDAFGKAVIQSRKMKHTLDDKKLQKCAAAVNFTGCKLSFSVFKKEENGEKN